MSTRADTTWIVERARSLGFDLCGVARAEKFPELSRGEEWLARGYAGEMSYLTDRRRSDPQSAMPGIRSVIVCALNYHSAHPKSIDALKADARRERGWISRYAWGDDYHEVLREKLRALAAALRERFTGEFAARLYSDTGPVNERVFAKHAGLGWLGKNTLLLNAKLGSWFFLGMILTTLDLARTVRAAQLPPADLCGSCTKCIDACPTGALVEPYVMDSRLCIAYLTIELRGSIPENLRERMGRHVFGCDICQDVCPWNRRAPATSAAEFQPRRFAAGQEGMALRGSGQASSYTPAGDEGSAGGGDADAIDGVDGERDVDGESLFLPRLEWLAGLSEEQFRRYFRGSPIKRTKWRGLIRNACIALGNAAPQRGSAEQQRFRALLERLCASPEAVISESAHWALSRIQ